MKLSRVDTPEVMQVDGILNRTQDEFLPREYWP